MYSCLICPGTLSQCSRQSKPSGVVSLRQFSTQHVPLFICFAPCCRRSAPGCEPDSPGPTYKNNMATSYSYLFMLGVFSIMVGKNPDLEGVVDNIPYGYCQCGCGEKTNLAPCSDASKGWRKDEPKKFIIGHARRLSPLEYLEVDCGYDSPCWVWQRAKDSKGYGRATIDGSTKLAHRIFYEKFVGPIPLGLSLDHLCRNPPCVNPSHLEPVTHAENCRRGIGGWNLRFESGNKKLTEEQVLEIRRLCDSGVSQYEVSRLFGMSQPTISKIYRRISWPGIEA